MSVNMIEYVNTRIVELKALKSETLNSIKGVTKTVEELSLEEEKELLENKMKYYSASGALGELEALKKLING